MTEETCRRELELEIPADEVQKAADRVAKEFARVARIPGFRPGKAPVGLVRRRFAEEIKSEVMQSLLPETIEKAVSEKKRAYCAQLGARARQRLDEKFGWRVVAQRYLALYRQELGLQASPASEFPTVRQM